MFGLFKRKPVLEGPLQFTIEVEIEASAHMIYDLLDFSNPANAKVQLGYAVTPAEDIEDRFFMCMPQMPEITFEFAVTEAEPGRKYAFDCRIDPMPGRLQNSYEEYIIEPAGEHACKLTQVVSVQFVDGLKAKELQHEVQMMAVACQNALIKLKVHAEQGVEMVRQIEEQQFAEA